MKKKSLMIAGIAGAAVAAAAVIASAATGDGFKIASMASVNGIVAEAETTEAVQATVDEVISNADVAVLAGADTIETAEQEEAQAETPVVSAPVVQVTEVTVSEVAVPSVPVVEVTAPKVETPEVKKPEVKTEDTVKEASAKEAVAVPAKEENPDESVKSYIWTEDGEEITPAPIKDNEDIGEPPIEEEPEEGESRLGCASYWVEVHSKEGEHIGYIFHCSVCHDWEVYDLDGNVVFSVYDEEEFSLTEEDAAMILE